MRVYCHRLVLPICFSLLYALPTYAIGVFLHPAPPSAVPQYLDPAHASFALARHLGLERFEKIGEGDGIWNGGLEDANEGLVGSAPREGLLITMSEEDAQGQSNSCPLELFSEESLRRSSCVCL